MSSRRSAAGWRPGSTTPSARSEPLPGSPARRIFESTISSDLAPKLAGTAAAGQAGQIAHAVAAGGTQQVLAATPAAIRPEASAAIHVAFTSAMNDILLIGGIIALAGAVLAAALVRSRDFATYGVSEPAAAPAHG